MYQGTNEELRFSVNGEMIVFEARNESEVSVNGTNNGNGVISWNAPGGFTFDWIKQGTLVNIHNLFLNWKLLS